jgi:polyisoprenoid-binding protein YceI
MKKLPWITTAVLSLASLVSIAGPARASDFNVDPTHSSVGFQIHHLVGKVNGNFTDFSGDFTFDEKKPTASTVEFTAKATSINTQNDKRDKHLRSSDFFDVEKFPTLSFKSTKVTPAGKNKYKLAGDLTIHGVTKPATFVLEFGGIVKDPWNNIRAGFTATTKLNRKDFGLVWNKTLDTGGFMLGDDVDVTLQIEAIEKAAPAATAKN